MDTYPKIVVIPPGPKARKLIQKDESLISPSYVRYYPLVVESGRGCIVKDVDGNAYIDLNSGLLCLNVGHNHPRVVSAIKSQCDRFLHYSNTDFYYEEVVNLAAKLVEITPGGLSKKVYFGNSGTEAIEAAIKLSKWHTRKHRFIAFVGAFHGRTIGALSFTASKPVQKRYFFPLMPGVTHVPYPYCFRCPFKLNFPECHYWCIDFIEDCVFQKYVPPEDVSAILFEPIQGEGGYIVPPPEYFQRLKKIADKYGILMIDDEVQSGMGRTGKWFAIEHWNVEPDVLCSAKALSSGLPLGATIAKSKIMDWISGSHASTFGGNPLGCVAGIAVIDVIEKERLLENATKYGSYIVKRLDELRKKSGIVGDVRGKGLMIGMEIVEDQESKKPAHKKATEIVIRTWKRGVALISCGVSTLRIAPPLNISQELIDASLEIIEDVVNGVERETKNA